MGIKTYEASAEAGCCGSVGTGVFSEGVGNFESSSSSCFRTTGAVGASVAAACSVLGGVAVVVASLAVLVDLPALPPPRPGARARAAPLPLAPPLAFGGILSE